MASGIWSLTLGTSIDLLLDNSANADVLQAAQSYTFSSNLDPYNCLIINIKQSTDATMDIFSYFCPYIGNTTNKYVVWAINGAYGAGVNSGCRSFTIDWGNNTLTQTDCAYNGTTGGSTVNRYCLLYSVYGIKGTRQVTV